MTLGKVRKGHLYVNVPNYNVEMLFLQQCLNLDTANENFTVKNKNLTDGTSSDLQNQFYPRVDSRDLASIQQNIIPDIGKFARV